ncbi:MAG: hypothetical protein KAI47_07500 [Deltaproteobacteria bacterium]|nr:hypothetical protein [Deltaproteobacteria bacterium]
MFVDKLTIDLEIITSGERISVATGDVKRLDLTLEPWGFRGEVEIWMWGETPADDPFLPYFASHDPVEVALAVALPETPEEILKVQGLVSDRRLEEQSFRKASRAPILVRRYTLSFEDRGAALWREHFPSVLETDVTLKEEIARQLPEGVRIDLSWDVLARRRGMLCLALGAQGPSFYDFLLWLVDRFDGVFAYDYLNQRYLLDGGKSMQGDEGKLRSDEIETIAVRLPAPPRASARVMNVSTEATGMADVAQGQAIEGVRRDVMVRSAIASDMDDRKVLETGRLEAPAFEFEVEFSRYPRIACHPWRPLSFQREFFSSALLGQGKTLRCQRLMLKAKAEDYEGVKGHRANTASFEMACSATFESEGDKVVRLPAFETVRYPLYAEGKIRCEIGEDGDRTYIVYTDDNSQTHYKVYVPLWNKEILVPFGPDFMPGHLYFPAFRDSRVLVALHFDEPELLRFLDWGADVQLPVDSQGNHILFGKNKTSETSARHYYEDSKPVFSIQRLENGDIELLSMSDGTLVLETREDSSLKSGSAKFDVTVDVAAGEGKLTMAAKGAISKISSGYEGSRKGLNNDLEGATTQTKASLDNMGGAINDKADGVDGKLDEAGAALAERTAKLKASAAEIRAKLEAQAKL